MTERIPLFSKYLRASSPNLSGGQHLEIHPPPGLSATYLWMPLSRSRFSTAAVASPGIASANALADFDAPAANDNSPFISTTCAEWASMRSVYKSGTPASLTAIDE